MRLGDFRADFAPTRKAAAAGLYQAAAEPSSRKGRNPLRVLETYSGGWGGGRGGGVSLKKDLGLNKGSFGEWLRCFFVY